MQMGESGGERGREVGREEKRETDRVHEGAVKSSNWPGGLRKGKSQRKECSQKAHRAPASSGSDASRGSSHSIFPASRDTCEQCGCSLFMAEESEMQGCDPCVFVHRPWALSSDQRPQPRWAASSALCVLLSAPGSTASCSA